MCERILEAFEQKYVLFYCLSIVAFIPVDKR